MNVAPDIQKIRELFDEAIDLPPQRRAQFLDEHCSDSPALRDAVQSLLRACDRAGEFLADPCVPADRLGPTCEIGKRIGPYLLLQLIGEGGHGSVFLAEQDRPLHRRVALKLIKPGMDTKQVIERFELERQALARMDHPNIARVFDAGATEYGRPYFVMELVKGPPITEFCRAHDVSLRWRLRLFHAVCSAVQHAHERGVIHRDLKPANVLVAIKDSKPIPKVIDFGIAKALAPDLAGAAMTLAYPLQFLGTPQYMSPEQTQVPAVEIDARSDVYSLGALLYELLTDSPPFDADAMRGMTMTDVIRTLREVDPPPPSARLAGASTTAGEARSRLRRRAQALRSDLDWIVAKAMEKDRSRRYESAAALAMDIANDLGDRPVLARPPTITYRLGKLARRHRRALVTTLVCVMTLILGFALAKWRSGSAPASMPISAPIPIATTRPSLSPGLLAEIYEGSRFDKLVSTRVDRTIDFSWPREVTPDPSIPPTHYSIRWTGVIVIPPGGATAIGTQANDGARLFLDDQEIIDRPRRGKTIDSRPIPPGPHTIRLEYWNTLAEGRVALLWVLNDQQQTIVPETSLFHSNTKPTTQSATPQ